MNLQGHDSDVLVTGPQSVIQGSTLSGVLYLLYILDLPSIFHNGRHNPQEQMECKRTNLETYVDDNYLTVTTQDKGTLNEAIYEAMNKVQCYTAANRLMLNKDKSQIMIITKDTNLRENFSIILDNKEIRHSRSVKILGNLINEDLSWEDHVNKELLPSLHNRLRTLKMVSKYLSPDFKKQYSNAIYKSKLQFGIETWGGCKKTTINRIQKIQDKVIELTTASKGDRRSMNKKQSDLKWLSVEDEIKMATFKMTYSILNLGQPEIMAIKMPQNKNGLRMESQKKAVNKTKMVR